MKRKLWTIISLVILCVLTIAVTINSSKAQQAEFEDPSLSAPTEESSPASVDQPRVKPLERPTTNDLKQFKACAAQPPSSRARQSAQALSERPLGPLTLERFRHIQPISAATGTAAATKGSAVSGDVPANKTWTRLATQPWTQPSQPPEQVIPIDPTNFGDRYSNDLDGNPVQIDPIVVFHETVGSASGTLNFFRTSHPKDDDQSSYHTLIRRDGTVLYLVPPDKRAYGAGNSIFSGKNGPEAVKTHPDFPPSVNNFAYHISLETPADGFNNAYSHSGYTDQQYQSLAWLTAKTGVPDHRITTHKAVDRSGQRMDPRSFSFAKFFQLLQTYPKTSEIEIRCTSPT
jgi:N-acetylmuramoyl-L-alanine amidase